MITSRFLKASIGLGLAACLTACEDTTNILSEDNFKLQLLHFADVDGAGGADDVRKFSALVAGFRAKLPNNTLVLSSGDNWIPGPEYYAAADDSMDEILGKAGAGRTHVDWLNTLGVQASAVGNHELDLGPEAFASIIKADGNWPGAKFPYLSANLDFSTDAATASLVQDGGNAPAANSVSASVVINVAGEKVGVIGATTPTLAAITSTGDIDVLPENDSTAELAAIIQAEVDELTAQGINKIVLLAHMQVLDIEKELATLLSDVDIIVAGGSNTLLADSEDRLRSGDEAADNYPLQYQSTRSEPVLVVNTAGDFTYLGRLFVEFDDNGVLILNALNENVSGVVPSDAIPDNSFQIIERIADVTTILEAAIEEIGSAVVAKSRVYIDGNRATVRTEESNMGNLTADANLWYAKRHAPETLISLKNGGGIRAPIGNEDESGNQSAPTNNEVTVGDLLTTLRFNNGLSLITLTAEELVDAMEYAVAGYPDQSGRFPQVAGIRFSFDPAGTAYEGTDEAGSKTAGNRIQSLSVVDDSGAVIDTVMQNGTMIGEASRTFRVVTLNFIASCVPTSDGKAADTCGDGYPYRNLANPLREDILGNFTDPGSQFDFQPGSEQDALAEYMQHFYADVAFDIAETDAANDTRIQRLDAVTADTVNALPQQAALTVVGSFKKAGAGFDESAAEIVAHDDQNDKLFIINAEAKVVDVIDFSDADISDETATSINVASALAQHAPTFAVGNINSVAVNQNLVAIAVEADQKTDNGRVAFYTADTLQFIDSIAVGALPDMLTFTPDGNTVVVANEGEVPADPNDGDLRDFANDVEGTISIISINRSGADPTFSHTLLRFADFNIGGSRANEWHADIRIEPEATSRANDLEPEYVAITADGNTAFVSLQENNAIAVVSLNSANSTINKIIPLGFKNHGAANNALDVSDKDDAINIRLWNGLRAAYMPDAIVAVTIGVNDYVVTANEGDSRDDVDELRFEDLTDPLDADVFANNAKDQDQLGRLAIIDDLTLNTDNDLDIETVTAFGGRSFSIFGDHGLVADSGDDFERITAHLAQINGSLNFNASNDDNDSDDADSRSDAKGPEPEGIVVGVINGRSYAFIGLERVGGIMMYDITNPKLPRFMTYLNNRDFNADAESNAAGDLGPEGLLFIHADNSPNGENLLVVGNEISGTTTVFQINLTNALP